MKRLSGPPIPEQGAFSPNRKRHDAMMPVIGEKIYTLIMTALS
jgi:hypothetical protein